MAYEVRLEVFEGPIDLLLHLITRQRVDIYEVSLATITDEYLGALDRMEAADLDVATSFLVVAATLLELKSLRLLPTAEAGEGDEALLEERDRLLARLVECATYRAAGWSLGAALREGERFHPRHVSLEDRYARPLTELPEAIELGEVVAAAQALLVRPPAPRLDTSHLAPITASVRETIAEVAATLTRTGTSSFERLCPAAAPRIEVVVRFLALLELFKAGAVTLSQAGRFGDIRARWTGDVDLDEVIAEAEEYTASVEDVR